MSPESLFRLLAISIPVVLWVGGPPAAAQRAPFDIVWQQSIPGVLYDVDFSADGQYVGAGGSASGEGAILIWAASDGTSTLDSRLGADVNAVVFAPDGTSLIAAHAGAACQPKGGCGGFGNELTRWAVPEGPVMLRRPYRQAYLSLEFTPDGQAFAGGNDYHPDNVAAQFHHPITLDSLRALPAVTADDVAFSPDGSLVVTGGFENLAYDGAALLWDASGGTVVRELPHNALSPYELEFPESVAFSPDGLRIATGGWDSFLPTVKVWRTTDGGLLHDLDVRTIPVDGYGGLGTHVAFSPNGLYLAGATSYEPVSGRQDLVVRFWEVATGALVAEYEMAGVYGNRGIRAFALSPTENVFALTTDNGTAGIVVARTHLDLVHVATDTEMNPGGYRLSSALPNPFSLSTALTLEVAAQQNVAAVVYDALGRRVFVLHDGVVPPGTRQRMVFDAGTLPNGAYIVRIQGETFTAARAITLAR